ncbi:MAG TPA: hypothetical protein VII06_41265 [Chloroflexota bacterium]|jgi:ABC-type nitrate/sulfonate/bicarbonate transport system substrate-binding protein
MVTLPFPRARGLDPDRDVIWVSTGGGFLEVLASLESGAADAADFSSPTNLEARKRGYVELVEVAAQGYPYQGSCLMARESYLSAHPDIARKIVRAYVDAVHRPDESVDDRFVRDLDAASYFAQLYGAPRNP